MKTGEEILKLRDQAKITPLAKRLLNRKIPHQKGYVKWQEVVGKIDNKRLALYLANALYKEGYLEPNNKDSERNIENQLNNLITLKTAKFYPFDSAVFPVIHIKTEMVAGMLNSDVDKLISQSIKKVYPQVMLLLPEGAVVFNKSGEQKEIVAVFLTYLTDEDTLKSYKFINCPNYEKGTLYSDYPLEPFVEEKDTSQLRILAIFRERYFCSGTISLDPTEDDFMQLLHDDEYAEIAAKLRAIAIQTYIMLEHTPEQFTETTYTPQTKQEIRACRLNPPEKVRWLGEHYTIRMESSSSSNGIKQRLHWVRGYYRQQRYGIGNLKTKIIWIQPFLKGTERHLENSPAAQMAA